ncbi:hypothetical protein Vau01_059560 [Virgisporangium aurantiacum]|uniref:Uncharacterized protein n=1 Tax=Virgisporangium aurantiacum TaxID=175570 RepID=A0A8J3ZAY7_9ACTN|nr:hypothetical protein Vau01_059560 [Virgisporangium aurantiacum]
MPNGARSGAIVDDEGETKTTTVTRAGCYGPEQMADGAALGGIGKAIFRPALSGISNASSKQPMTMVRFTVFPRISCQWNGRRH